MSLSIRLAIMVASIILAGAVAFGSQAIPKDKSRSGLCSKVARHAGCVAALMFIEDPMAAALLYEGDDRSGLKGLEGYARRCEAVNLLTGSGADQAAIAVHSCISVATVARKATGPVTDRFVRLIPAVCAVNTKSLLKSGEIRFRCGDSSAADATKPAPKVGEISGAI